MNLADFELFDKYISDIIKEIYVPILSRLDSNCITLQYSIL